MECPSVVKQAFIGGKILWDISPEDLKTDVAPIDLKRAIRKHKNLALPKVKERLAISKGVESLRKGIKKKVPNLTFNRDLNSQMIGNNTIASPNRYSMFTGHEYGHALDGIIHKKNKNFFGDRGLFGIGGNPKSALNSEASATQHLLKRLPKKIRRKYGPRLAHAYDTYVSSARLNPEGKIFLVSYPKKYKKTMGVINKLTEGFKDPPTNIPRMNDPIAEQSYKVRNVRKSLDLVEKRQKTLNSIKKKRILKTMKKRNAAKLYNRKALIRNAKKLSPKDMKILKKEIRHYLKQTRANFGVNTARGVADELRALNKQVAWSKKTKLPGVKAILKKLPKMVFPYDLINPQKLKRLMKFIK